MKLSLTSEKLNKYGQGISERTINYEKEVFQ